MRKLFKFSILFLLLILTSIVKGQWEQTNGPNHSINCFSTSGNNLYAGTSNGVYLSYDNGTNWIQVVNDLTSLQINNIDAFGSNIVAISNDSDLSISFNNGNTWTNISNGLPQNQRLSGLKIRSSNIYVTSNGIADYSHYVLYSSNNGSSWVTLLNYMDIDYFLRAIDVSGSNIIVGNTETGIVISTNNGLNWNWRFSTLSSNSVFINDNDFLSSSDQVLVKSTNLGLNWNSINTIGAYYSIIKSEGILFVNKYDYLQGSVFPDFSIDRGTNWFSFGQGLPNGYGSLAATNEYVFTCRGENVYRRPLSNITPISVIQPNGSENLIGARNYEIKWFATSAISNIKIEFTSNSGGTWSNVNINYPADSGRFNWNAPNVNSTQCKIKISEANNPSLYDVSDSIFTISPVTLNTGLIAYYPFNGNVNDESGNNNHGINNGATFTTDLTETQNNALDFNGISNFVSIPDFNILNNNSLTFSCIIYPRSLNTSVSVYHGYSGEIQMNTYNGNQLGVGVKLSDNNWYFSNVNALPNNWYLLTGVWERGNSVKLYLNGQLQSQNSVPDYDLYEEHFHNSSIGAYSRFMYPPDARPFNGKIDEVRFYNRALSQSEIQKLYNQVLAFAKPVPYSKWISGESDTIRWINQGWTSYNIKCLLNYGTPSQSEYIIDDYINDTSYIWNIPGSLLSFRSKIIVQNSDNVNQSIESNVFRIKPYLLTKLNPDSTYYEYSIGKDNWRYENGRPNFWFEEWYNQFNYLWIDPFTERFFPLKYFVGAFEDDFPDWVSWVNTFSIEACYSNYDEGKYSPTAIARWKAVKRRNAKYPGSCFGLALTNAMAFNYKSQFLRRYPDFPEFKNPHDVIINDNVRKITNELWTHQLGQPHKKFLNESSNTFPTKTLDSLKDLLSQDNCIVKMLGIRNLNIKKGGAHMILPYKIEKLYGAGEYNILTYDNNSPDVPQLFLIKTLENGGNGSWSSQIYNEWGGAKGIILSDEVYNYFFTPLIEQTNATSPFTVDDSLLQVYNPGNADFVIKDFLGNISGTINDSSFNNIENSIPVYSFGGFEGPPYMFNLQTGSYSVTLKNFNSDKIESYLFTGNKSFTYSREEISSNQTDVILFDGNITALNEDSQTKQIALSSIIKESSDEKVVHIKSLNLQQNDSVKLVNIQDEDFKLISYGTQKQYELELDYVAPTGTDRFINSNIVLSANSSHTILPEWNNISNGTVTILEDIGNNGTIDDTINIANYSVLNLTLSALIEGLYDKLMNRMVPDTVTVLLREKTVPFALADSARDVLSTKGKGFFTFYNAQHLSPYYIVVKHKNSVEVWSDSSIVLFGNNTNIYSFVKSSSFAYGNNLVQVDSTPLSFALFSGDINQDGIIDASDLSQVENDASNSLEGYAASDLNGDNFVDASDLSIVENNIGVGVITP